MPIFEFQNSQGQVFELDAPDQQSAMEAFTASQANTAPQAAPEADAWTPSKREVPSGWNEIAQTPDGGSVYEAQDGSRQFVSPSYSTQSPDEIDQIMSQGDLRTPSMGTGEGIARGVVQGATLNFGDEIVAAGAAALDPLVNNTGQSTFGERYDARVGNERDNLEQFREEQPATALASELTGSLAAGAGIASGGASLANRANSLKGLVAGGAVDGAVFGGLAGAGAGEEGNRTGAAITGGLVGGATGAATPLAIAGAKKLAQPLVDGARTAFASPQTTVNARMAQAMREAGKSNDEIAAELVKLGDEGMLVDTLGASGEGLARSASNTNPAARDILEDAVAARTAGQPDRLTNKLLEASGLDQPQTINELLEAQREATQPAIRRAYNTATAEGFDLPSSPFDDLMQSPRVAKAVKGAEKSVLDRAVMEGQDAGSKLSVFDAAKKSLDDQASSAYRAGNSNDGEVAAGLAKALRERVDDHIPKYGGARKLAQQAAQGRNAIELGAQGAKPKIPADFGRQMQNLTPDQAQGAAQGYAASKIDQIQGKRATAGAVDQFFGSNRQQSALQDALGKRAAPVQQQIANEKVFAGTARGIQGNSSTARQLMEMGAIGAGGAGAGLATGGDGKSAGIGMLGAIAAKKAGGAALRGLTANKEQQIAPIVAKILTGKMPAQQVQELVKSNPMINEALSRAIALQSAGRAGATANQ